MNSPRFAILADIHGFLPSLKAALAEIQSDPPDEIIVAGDFVGGPQPHETLALLRDFNCQFILGNGELNMLRMHNGTAPEAWWSHRQFDLARWNYNHLTEEDLHFMASLPEQRTLHPPGTNPIRVVHAFPWGPGLLWNPKTLRKNLSKTISTLPKEVLIFAHDHCPGIYRSNEKLALNPGSLSNNLDGTPGISYATLAWDGMSWQPEIHPMTLEPDTIQQTLIETGFLEATRPLGRAIYESVLTGENIPHEFFMTALKYAEEAGVSVTESIPDASWLLAGETFPWQFEL